METCPVPTFQRPLTEFRELTKSWFFKWPTISNNELYKNLILSWILIYPIILTIESGSIVLKAQPIKLFFLGAILSLALPFLITIRLLIGWHYILKRLISEKIEYEESGWYDGQSWEKPVHWQEKDILIAQYEVQPIINLLRNALAIILFIFISLYLSINILFNTI